MHVFHYSCDEFGTTCFYVGMGSSPEMREVGLTNVCESAHPAHRQSSASNVKIPRVQVCHLLPPLSVERLASMGSRLPGNQDDRHRVRTSSGQSPGHRGLTDTLGRVKGRLRFGIPKCPPKMYE